MVKLVPENVKEVLGQLSGPQQVAIRTYIASLRSEIKDLEEQLLTKNDPDPHAHFHGHEKVSECNIISKNIRRHNLEKSTLPFRKYLYLTLHV